MSEYATQEERYAEIARRIEVIGRYYDVDAISSRGKGNQDIADYYKASDFYYDLAHCGGTHNIHMGLSDDGEFHVRDFKKQAQYIAEQIGPDTRRVLEVGAGKAANTKYLAKQFPEIKFTALDLPNRNFLKTRVPSNVTLVEGDYNDLSGFEEGSFDLVFGVETICHGSDKNQTYKEISRVLSPGGKLIVFDVYEPQPKTAMTDFEKDVNKLILASMCVTEEDLFIGDTKKYLERNDFDEIEITDLTEQIRPSIARHEWLFGKWFRHPDIMRFFRHFINENANQNSIAGWMMNLAFDGKRLLQYDRVTAIKKNTPE